MGTVDRPCVEIFGLVRGAAMHHLVEDQTGRPCPCCSGLPCPLLDSAGHSPLLRLSLDERGEAVDHMAVNL